MSEKEIRRIASALEAGDSEQAIGAFRILSVGGALGAIPVELAAGLGVVLENAGLWREALELYREVYESHPGSAEAMRLLLRAALVAATAAELPAVAHELASRLAREGDAETRQACGKLLSALGMKDYVQIESLAKQHGIELPESWSPPFASPAPSATAGTAAPGPSGGWKEFSRKRASSRGAKVAVLLAAFFAACWLLGGLMDERLSGVSDIDEQLLSEPVQKPLEGEPEPIHTRRGDYNLTLYPRYSYRICGLVVSVNDYAMLGLRYQDFYSRDFCMVWGENITSNAYKAPGSSFGHHGNVCYYRYSGIVRIRKDQLSNTHIFPATDEVEDLAESVKTGDQICLEGKLVDVSVVPASFDGPGLPPAPQRLETSTTRTDKGVGACEILYLERIEVLRRGNRFWRLLGFLGFWGMVLSLAVALLFAVFESRRARAG